MANVGHRMMEKVMTERVSLVKLAGDRKKARERSTAVQIAVIALTGGIIAACILLLEKRAAEGDTIAAFGWMATAIVMGAFLYWNSLQISKLLHHDDPD